MLEFLFDIVAGLQLCNFLKRRLQHRCFAVKFAKFLEQHLQITASVSRFSSSVLNVRTLVFDVVC